MTDLNEHFDFLNEVLPDGRSRVWARPKAGGEAVNIEIPKFVGLARRAVRFSSTKDAEKMVQELLEDVSLQPPVRVERQTHYDRQRKLLCVSIGAGQVVGVTPMGLQQTVQQFRTLLLRDSTRFVPLDVHALNRELGRFDPALPHLRAALLDGLPKPGGSLTRDEQAALILAFLIGVFLHGRAAGRPILLLLGEPASGKTLTGRVMGTLLYGPGFREGGGADGARAVKDLCAALADHPLEIRDDFQKPPQGIQDVLCRVVTGAGFELASFYDTLGSERRGCNGTLVLTAINPTWLNRVDLMGRVLFVKFAKAAAAYSGVTEDERTVRAASLREGAWAELLMLLTCCVGELPPRARATRFDEWELAVAPAMLMANMAAAFDSALGKMPGEQRAHAEALDPLVAHLAEWVKHPGNAGQLLPARDLITSIGSAFGAGNDGAAVARMNALELSRLLQRLRDEGSPAVRVSSETGRSGTLLWRLDPVG